MLYEKLINMLPMTFEKWYKLSDDDKDDYKDLCRYINDHIRKVQNCLEVLDILEDIAKEQPKGYKRSKIEILVNKYVKIFDIQKARGLYKKIDALRWKLKYSVLLFDWRYETIVSRMLDDLFNVY